MIASTCTSLDFTFEIPSSFPPRKSYGQLGYSRSRSGTNFLHFGNNPKSPIFCSFGVFTGLQLTGTIWGQDQWPLSLSPRSQSFAKSGGGFLSAWRVGFSVGSSAGTTDKPIRKRKIANVVDIRSVWFFVEHLAARREGGVLLVSPMVACLVTLWPRCLKWEKRCPTVPQQELSTG